MECQKIQIAKELIHKKVRLKEVLREIVITWNYRIINFMILKKDIEIHHIISLMFRNLLQILEIKVQI